MSHTVFEDPVSGHNAFAGLSASSGGTINVHLGATSQSVELATRSFSTVPFPPDPKFVKRPAISKWLQSTLVGPGCRAALVGLGGVGKSQIAIQHAYDTRRDAPDTYVLWVHASSSARFQEAYQDIAERLKLPGRDDPQQNVLRLVWRWLLDEENGPWLMIIDSADDGSALFSSQAADNSGNERSLSSYIPKTGQGSVLITSRSTEVAQRLVGDDNIFQVPVMGSDQAMQLLRVRLGRFGGAVHDDAAASSLLFALDYLPLAIIQAASFIQRKSLRRRTITWYLEEIQKSIDKKTGLLASEANDLRRDESASNAVVTTWQITFDQVRRDRPSAIELLCFMSFFNPQGIPEPVLISYYEQEEGKDIEGDLEILFGYSLIAAVGNGQTLEMHALVQFCTQVWLMTFDNKERWRCKFVSILSLHYPFGEFENWTACRELEPHIQIAVGTCPTAEADIKRWCILMQNAGWYRHRTGQHGAAEQMNRQTLYARTKVLGAEHPDTLTSMNNLALTLWAQGKNGEAEKMNRQTLYARTKVLGAEHPGTLTSMSNLASTLRAQGKNGEAEEMNRQTLEAMTKVLGAEHPETLTSMNNLASTLWAQGKNGESEKMNHQTLEARTKVLGAEHPDTLTSMSNLALTLWAQGKNGEAEKMNRQTLNARTKVLGAEHPDTLTSMSNLALTLRAQGKNGEAEKMNSQTLEAMTKVLGAEHPDTLTSMNNLAHTLWSLGERSDAAALLQDCVRLREISLGIGHPHTQAVKMYLDKWASEL